MTNRTNQISPMTRREAMLGLSVAALGATGASASVLNGILSPGPASGEPQEDAAAVEDRLRKQLAEMAKRENSEEGVPVMLVCIDLVPQKGKHAAKVAGLNKAFAAEFHSNAEAWIKVKPEATADNVTDLIQVLASRDFAAGGTGGQR